MKRKFNRLELIIKLNLLTEIKENLESDLMNPLLKRSERMELYESLHCINNRIDLLKKRMLKRTSR